MKKGKDSSSFCFTPEYKDLYRFAFEEYEVHSSYQRDHILFRLDVDMYSMKAYNHHFFCVGLPLQARPIPISIFQDNLR